MKAIEDKAKPILSPLIKGGPSSGAQIRIDQRQMSVIAAWAALKVMVAEFDEGNQPITHHMQRQYMRRHGLAPKKNWGVWIGHFDRKDWLPEWISHPFLLLPDAVARKRPSRYATHFNGNSTTQVIEKLFIHVIHSPMPNLVERWQFALPEGGTLFRIWPPPPFSIVWPGKPLSDIDADFAADAFKSRLLRLGREAIPEGWRARHVIDDIPFAPMAKSGCALGKSYLTSILTLCFHTSRDGPAPRR